MDKVITREKLREFCMKVIPFNDTQFAQLGKFYNALPDAPATGEQEADKLVDDYEAAFEELGKILKLPAAPFGEDGMAWLIHRITKAVKNLAIPCLNHDEMVETVAAELVVKRGADIDIVRAALRGNHVGSWCMDGARYAIDALDGRVPKGDVKLTAEAAAEAFEKGAEAAVLLASKMSKTEPEEFALPDAPTAGEQDSDAAILRVRNDLLIKKLDETHEFWHKEVTRLKDQLQDSDNFQCDIASALGWPENGKTFVEHVRDLVKEVARLKAEMAAVPSVEEIEQVLSKWHIGYAVTTNGPKIEPIRHDFAVSFHDFLTERACGAGHMACRVLVAALDEAQAELAAAKKRIKFLERGPTPPPDDDSPVVFRERE